MAVPERDEGGPRVGQEQIRQPCAHVRVPSREVLAPGFLDVDQGFPDERRVSVAVLLVWLGLGAVSLIVGWVRFRRFADLHLYSAKVAVVAGLAFAVYLLAVGSYDVWIFRAVALIAFIAILETIIVQLTFEEVDEHIGSVFTIRRRSPVR